MRRYGLRVSETDRGRIVQGFANRNRSIGTREVSRQLLGVRIAELFYCPDMRYRGAQFPAVVVGGRGGEGGANRPDPQQPSFRKAATSRRRREICKTSV